MSTPATDSYQLGFVALARTTFDMPLAGEMIERIRSQLSDAGFTLRGPSTPLTSTEEADQAIAKLSGEDLDLLLIFQATFADSGMAQQLAECINAPLLFWAVPEAPTGGRLRLNSYCGVNLAAHALRRAGEQFEAVYAAPGDPAAMAQVTELARAGRIQRQLRATRIGRIGVHPGGFETCEVDRDALSARLGVEVVQYELDSLFDEMRAVPGEEIRRLRENLRDKVTGLDEVDENATDKTLAGYVVMRRLAGRDRLNAFAVRCWPQFFTDIGCAACGALSLLSDEQLPASCECDVNGAITQLIMQWVAGAPSFDTDMVAVDEDNDAVICWHCGKAPLSFADPTVTPVATIHSNRRLPLLWEFPLKPGPVTIARLSAASGEFRFVLTTGEMLRGEPSFSGTSGRCRMRQPAKEFMAAVLQEGLEHHVTLAYGEHLSTLKKVAGLLRLPTLEL